MIPSFIISILWTMLPIWIIVVYFNIRKYDKEPVATAIINGTILWLLYGGFIAIGILL